MTAVHNPSPSTPCEERLAKIYTYIDDPLSCQDLEELQAHWPNVKPAPRNTT